MNDYGAKLEAIMTWAEDKPDFDTSFVESMQERYESTRGLTSNMEQAIDNIIDQWRIEV